jgi:hypothetical protein
MHATHRARRPAPAGRSTTGLFLARVRRPRTLIVLAVVLLAVVAVGVKLTPHSSGRCRGLFVPAYFYPGPEWTRVDHSKPGNLILDITSTGAGASPSEVFATAARQVRASGITILGYSSTEYGQRPLAQVEADVRNYKAWYGVTSTFLDEVPVTGSQVPYYQKLVSYIRHVNPGAAVWINPGTYPDEHYMSLGAVVMVFEGPYSSYVNSPVPSWARHYPAARFANVIYRAPGSKLASTLSLAKSRDVGHIYVTDGTGSNPYGSLPSYWSSEASGASPGCSG